MNTLKKIIRKKGPFVIAEIGVNYYDIASKWGISPIDAAKTMIDEALGAGADAVKFQTYKAEKIVSKNSKAYWDMDKEPTTSQFKLFKKFDKFGKAQYAALADHCKKAGGIFASTPFDFESANYLDPLMPFYKISSSDLTNLPFIAHMSKKGKPILLSTGASTIGEIDVAVDTIKATGNTDICLLHCILDYPTDYKDANLNVINHLAKVFPDCMIGYSDHTCPDDNMAVLLTAYLLGAKVIEKHFTLDKSLPGNDHYHAMDPDDLRKFKTAATISIKAGGANTKQVFPCEENSRKHARRSIVATKNIKKGEKISMKNVSFKRPGTGISPSLFDTIKGRPAKRNIKEDTLLCFEDI